MNTKTSALVQSISESLRELVSVKTITTAFAVLVILIIGFGIVRLLLNAIKRVARKGLPHNSAMILKNVIKYGGGSLVLLLASKRAGLDITALLGAAGVAGIALGFAAQTSVSNIISGLFLFSEKAFKIGDVLQIDALSGIVESIDLMCVRIKTFDGRLVRVPNETLIKSNIVNVTYFPQRRLDIWLTLPHGCDYPAARQAIQNAIAGEALALKTPEPIVMLDAVTQDGTTLLAGAWYDQDNYVAIKNALPPAIIGALAAEGIEVQSRRIDVSSTYPIPGTSRGT